MHFPPDIEELAAKVVSVYAAMGKKIVTTESCTGGLIAGAITSIAGSSAVFERGFVSYSNESKTELLGVMPEMIDRFGAVSAEVAEEMAQGALDFSHADIAVSITGIAGPSGGTPQKPVGLVFFGLVSKEGTRFHLRCEFQGSREHIRRESVKEALKLLLSLKSE